MRIAELGRGASSRFELGDVFPVDIQKRTRNEQIFLNRINKYNAVIPGDAKSVR